MTTRSGNKLAAHKKGRRCVLWFLLALAAIQTTLFVAENTWPQVRDIEYRYKLARLRKQIEANPDRPLLLLVGSSRTQMGLRPDVLMSAGDDANAPIIFNFGMQGAGPVSQLLQMRRLLEAGVRPDAVMIEVHPLLLHQNDKYSEGHWLLGEKLRWKEIRELEKYTLDSWPTKKAWMIDSWRHQYLWAWAPKTFVRRNWGHFDAHGWWGWGVEAVTPEDFQTRTNDAINDYAAAFKDFKISAIPDRALRELLDLCHSEGMSVALYLMPEGSQFANAYPADDRQEINDYLASIARDYSCPLYDATEWAEDHFFLDSHHLLPSGAVHISQRFVNEALQPLVTELIAKRAAAPLETVAREAGAITK